MTTSGGSSITLRVDRYPFNAAAADVGGGMVYDGGQTGNGSTGSAAATRASNIGEHRVSEWIHGGPSAADRRRSFAAMTFSPLSIEVETTDIEDEDDDEKTEKDLNMRLLSEDIQTALLDDHLHLEEALPLPTTTTTDCSSPEVLDRVTTLRSFSPAENYHRRRPLAAGSSRYPTLHRCFSTTVDTWSHSRLGGSRAPRRRRTSWCSFDDKPEVRPDVERCRQRENADAESTEDGTKRAADSDQDAEQQVPETAQASLANVYLRDQLRAMFHVADNRLAMKLFGSHNALLKEKQRQRAIGNFVIHPCSSFRYRLHKLSA